MPNANYVKLRMKLKIISLLTRENHTGYAQRLDVIAKIVQGNLCRNLESTVCKNHLNYTIYTIELRWHSG